MTRIPNEKIRPNKADESMGSTLRILTRYQVANAPDIEDSVKSIRFNLMRDKMRSQMLY